MSLHDVSKQSAQLFREAILPSLWAMVRTGEIPSAQVNARADMATTQFEAKLLELLEERIDDDAFVAPTHLPHEQRQELHKQVSAGMRQALDAISKSP